MQPAGATQAVKLGNGVFATQKIARGSVLFDFPGTYCRESQYDQLLGKLNPNLKRRAIMYDQQTNPVRDVGKKLNIPPFVILAHRWQTPALGHTVNHSPHAVCQNVEVIQKLVKFPDGYRPVLLNYALRDIEPGEELLRDYGTEYYWPDGKVLCPRCGKYTKV